MSVAAFALLALALYARGFTLGLVGDDDTLLDAALRVPLAELLTGRHGILGYYRPVSRELYFWIWGHLFGPSALGYHVVNAITFAGVVTMLFLFVRRWLGARTGLLAALALLLFPPCGALLSWVSCAQDLIALFWCAASLLLYQSRRYALAGLAVALAALSKETAAVMPLVLVAYEWAAGDGAAANAGVAARGEARTGDAPARARWSRPRPRVASDRLRGLHPHRRGRPAMCAVEQAPLRARAACWPPPSPRPATLPWPVCAPAWQATAHRLP